MGQRLTPVFPPNIRPARAGVYKIATIQGAPTKYPWYAYWDGRLWGWCAPTPAGALLGRRDAHRANQNRCWQGLTQQAKD